ncbi:MAG: hypothetical protein LBL72_02890 [Candidatus Accumulibacter sp.]|nr:hypothetical protein [Accumulibacter sp.]
MPLQTPDHPCRASRLRPAFAKPGSQRGVVLLIALVVLVALTLAATTLVRSVDTTNLIAGNLAFHESAVLSGERGTELGFVNWLEAHNLRGDATLYTNNTTAGYRALREDPAAGVSWDAFWNATLKDFAFNDPTKDAAGNTVSYIIHRLCDAEGEPGMVTCYKANIGTTGDSNDLGGIPLQTKEQIYYRITTRIAGPRNTVAYIQTIIAL